MAKQLMFGEEGRRKILDGVRKLARAVKVTMGPTGKVVVLDKSYGGPNVTKDGVTVAKEIELEDKFENMGAQMVRQVAQKTSDVVGDGTTTATVLAEAIYSEGLKRIVSGANPTAVKRGIDAAVGAVVGNLEKMSKPCKKKSEIAQVATISANNDETIGGLLADAMEKVGTDGVVTVEEAQSMETTLDLVEGMQFDKGYISPYFMNKPETMTCDLEDPFILIHEKKISNLREFIPLLDKVAQAGKPLLVMAEDVEAEALAALVVNRLRGTLQCCAVKAPGFGERRKAMLQDMAILTAGKCISEDLGIKLENVELADLGRAKKVTVDKDSCTIVRGAGKASDVAARVTQIKNQIETTTSDYDREKLEERLAKLVGGVAVINVGAATEAEAKEKKARIEDALHASRAAAEEGVLPGGGVAYLRSLQAVEKARKKLSGADEQLGTDIIAAALRKPLACIAENTGLDGSVVVEEVLERKGSEGLNASTKEFVDMVKAGIIDPTKVARSALQNAASVAGLLLTTDTMVTELPEEDETEKATAGAVT